MNKRLIFKTIGFIMLIEAALMLLPMIVGLLYGEEDWVYFLYTLLMVGAAGGLLVWLMRPKKRGLFASDGFIITAAAWLVLSAVGAIPFSLAGLFPTYLDSLFETVSGFTTTGVSILPDIEVLSHCMLFWRGFTNWIGGMGVLVFMIALAPVAGGSTIHLYKAEAPGPINDKITAKISTGAKYLYYLYIAITFAQIIALKISGLSLFHSAIVTFGTVATGGYTYLNASLATLTVAQQIIVEVFMLIAGANFTYFFLLVTGKFKKARKNTEVKIYVAVAVIAALIITYNLCSAGMFDSFGMNLHHSFFATISALTSTGFVSGDMNLWPWFSKGILLLLMFIGGCSSSTAGGIKVCRFIIMMKALKNYMRELSHPRSVSEVKLDGKKVGEPMIRSTLLYFCLIMVIAVLSMIIVSQDPQMDFFTSFSSVATTINNNGIEFKSAGVGADITYQWFTKIVFIFDMLIGRLEIFPILVLMGKLVSPAGMLFKKVRKSTL